MSEVAVTEGDRVLIKKRFARLCSTNKPLTEMEASIIVEALKHERKWVRVVKEEAAIKVPADHMTVPEIEASIEAHYEKMERAR